MIRIENVSKRYSKNAINVIDNISFEILEGESIAFLGANGSGKTTLVEMIAGIIEPTEGKIIHSNENSKPANQKENKFKNTIKKIFLREEDSYLQKNVGIQFQNGNWPFNTKPIDLLNFFVGSKWKKDDYINNLIDVFEVKNILKKRIARCSGGEQQRFNCLLSIINKPRILILDELITGLDLKMQIKLINFFSELRKKENLTLIIVSHIPEEVEQMSDRIIILNEGKIYRDYKKRDVIKQFGSTRTLLENFFGGKL